MILDNFDKIIGLVGLMIGVELIAIVLFTASILYLRCPEVVAGIIANLSSFGMTLGIIGYSINRERNNGS